MKKQKDKTYAFRISSSDLKKIKTQAKRAKMTVTDYLTECALGKAITVFRDRGVYQDEHSFHTERVMKVDDKSFYVKSFFPSTSKTTPTDQLLKLINNAAKK